LFQHCEAPGDDAEKMLDRGGATVREEDGWCDATRGGSCNSENRAENTEGKTVCMDFFVITRNDDEVLRTFICVVDRIIQGSAVIFFSSLELNTL